MKLLMKHLRFLFIVLLFFLSLHLTYTPASWAQNAKPAKNPAHILPTAPPQTYTKDLPTIDRVYIERIEIHNNTIFSAQEIETIAGPFTKRELTFEDLDELRNQINLYYLSRGYINSGVILPDQKIQNGIVTFKAIEGRITDIQIIDYDKLKPSFIKKRVALGTGPPLNINQLQERLQMLETNPLIQRLNVQLNPGDKPGEANMKVNVKENNPYYMALSLNNSRSPAVGSEVFELEVAHNNLSGHGDSLFALFGVNEGILDFLVNYTLPVTAKDTLLNVFYSKSDSTVVEEPFDEIDIESDEIHYGVSLNHPFVNTPHDHLRMGLMLEKIDYKTYLFGRPFSFSQGIVDGESNVTVVRFSQEWLSRTSSQVIALNSVFSLGIDALGADSNEPYTDFFMWLGQFQWTRRLAKPFGGQVLARVNVQLTGDPLLPFEKFTIGGIDSVRGYREDELVRDKGFFGSLEYRYPLLNLRVPKVSKSKDDGLLQLILFTDWGWGENNDLPTPAPSSIGSAGLGLRWYASTNLLAEIYYGYAFRDIDHLENDLQDYGIHFNFRWQIF
jgi:hemolysin activation/secretion protein